MKTLVAYGSRWGTTRRCAQWVGETLRLKGHAVDLVDLGEGGRVPSTRCYDLVVVGAGARMGKLHEKARRFVNREQDQLGAGQLALFTCCGEKTEEGIRRLFWTSYPPGLMDRARSAVSLGGRIVRAELEWPWKQLLAKIEDYDTVDETRVRAWAASLG